MDDEAQKKKVESVAVISDDAIARYILSKNPQLYHEILQNFMRETG